MSNNRFPLKLVHAPEPSYEVSFLIEEANKEQPRRLYLEGIYIKHTDINGNGRFYLKEEVDEQVDVWTESHIKTGRSMGELNHPACCTVSAKILCKNGGFRGISEVVEGDEILTWDITTNKMDYNPVLKKIEQEYEGEMFQISGKNIDTYVTPDHRFPVTRRYGKVEMVKIKDIYADRKKYDKSKFSKSLPDMSASDYSSDEFILPGVQAQKLGNFKRDVTKPISIDKGVFFSFMGIWLAEGWTVGRKSETCQGGYVVGISQRKESVKLQIRELLGAFPHDMEWNEQECSNGTSTFTISDKALYDYLTPFGKCYDKFIAPELKNDDVVYLEMLLDWFQMGDGRYNLIDGGRFIQENMFSTSYRLIEDLQEILVKTGGSGNISTTLCTEDYVFADRIIKSENKKPLHTLNINRSVGIYLDPRFLSIEKVNTLDIPGYDGKVYCVTVKNETFYLKDNEKCVWSGNSPDINPERAAHRVTSLKSNGSNGYIGRSLILESVPCGKILAGLYRDGCQTGMSTRALGQVHEAVEGSEGSKVTNMRLITIDSVTDPSVGEYTNCVLEGREWFVEEDGGIKAYNALALERLNTDISKLPKNSDAKHMLLAEAVERFVRSLR